MAEPLSHPVFKRCPQSEATAFGWAFEGPNQSPVEYPYQIPEPLQDEVRIKVTYGGICHSDKCIEAQSWGFGYYPCVLGHEVVGRVEQIGSQVTQFKIGEIVGAGLYWRTCNKCQFCLAGNNNLCTNVQRGLSNSFGGFATHLNVHTDWLFPIPSSLDESKVGPLLCAGITAFSPIETHCKAGERTAIIGIGGVGHLAIQIGAAWGLKVAAISSSPNKEKEARSLGASEFIVAQSQEELNKYAEQFDNVIFCASTTTKEALIPYIKLARKGGKFIMLGLPEKDQQMGLPFSLLIFYQIQLIGSMIGSSKQFYRFLDFCSRNQILPLCEEFDYQDFGKAYEHAIVGNPKYRVVLQFGDFFQNWKGK